MAAALQELTARLGDLRANVQFVTAAAGLRPRLGELINWQLPVHVRAPGQALLDARASRPEGLYGALLVVAVAAFERFNRQLVEFAVDETARKAKAFTDVSEHVRLRNTALTGRALASIDSPRDHVSFDYHALAENLSSCNPESKTFRLNASAFSAEVSSGSPAILERALGSVDIKEWWDAVGASTSLQKLLQTKRSRETALRARERLVELWRWRNHIAHGGDEDISLSDGELSGAIDFIEEFSRALDLVVRQRLK